MQLRHLHYLVAVADAGSVSAAAERVHVTQPALSRQLRQLEDELGVELFERGAGRLRLSRTGRELLPAVRRLLADAAALEATAAYHAQGRISRLRVAAPMVTMTDVVSPFVATMAPDEPVVDVVAGDGLSTTSMLEAGADLAIGTDRPGRPYRWLPLAVLPVLAYVRAEDPWATRVRVPLEELVQRPLIGLPSTFTARESLDAALVSSGLSAPDFAEVANGTVAQALAASGRGVAVVSDDARFGLVPLAIGLRGQQAADLSVRLVAAWDGRSVATYSLQAIAVRLSGWATAHYGVPRE
ncbi:LysR family transcriptional regulator [Nocardioides sp. BP30]|uniref:LysR family transcriptional regulator n=1 Tax=Nocardioides sp. BP30 TaxID=3036374 RepID=UPI00246836F2|nr:LysR family transcriptional regulator [Nocardioides sp. BP30]WGL51952.1 LysR family transcriptional regulator [Nocardioides sp. BP30]